LTPGSQLIVNERESGNMLQAEISPPRWTKPLTQMAAHTSRTGSGPLAFRTEGFEGGASVAFLPWYRLAHERYQLYWQQGSTQS